MAQREADAALATAAAKLDRDGVAATVTAASEATREAALRAVLVDAQRRAIEGFTGNTTVESVTGDLIPLFVVTGGLAALLVLGPLKLRLDRQLKAARAIVALLLELRTRADAADNALLLVDVGGTAETRIDAAEGNNVGVRTVAVSLLGLAYVRSSAPPATNAVYDRTKFTDRIGLSAAALPRTTLLAYAALLGNGDAVRTVLERDPRTDVTLRTSRYTLRPLELQTTRVFSAGELAVLGAEPPSTSVLGRIASAAGVKGNTSERDAIDVLRALSARRATRGGDGGDTAPFILQSAAADYSLLQLAAKYGLAQLTRYIGEQLSRIAVPQRVADRPAARVVERSLHFRTRAALPTVRTDVKGRPVPSVRIVENVTALEVATEMAKEADRAKDTRAWAKAVRKCVDVLLELATKPTKAVGSDISGGGDDDDEDHGVGAARAVLATPFSCDWCDAPREAAHRCAGCREQYYCSAACQRNDWVYGAHALHCARQ